MSLTLTGVSDSGGGGPAPPSTQKIVAAGYTIISTRQVFAIVRYAHDGSRDATFGTGGLTTTSFGVGTDSIGRALAVQADGKYVVAGNSGVTFALARYSALGAIDSAGFGTGGKVTTVFGTHDNANAVAIQADGKIIAAGFATNGATGAVTFALARYNTDGSLDASFGTGGKVTTDFGATTPVDQSYAVLIQADGKIVAVGVSTPNSGTSEFALARYSAVGVLDAAFGTGGKVTTSIGVAGAAATAAALQGDGKIVAAGFSADVDGFQDFTVARYNTDGTLDTGFGTGGVVVTSLTSSVDEALAVVIQADGKVVAAGQSATSFFAAARYTTAGVLDPTFGTGGVVSGLPASGATDQFSGVAVQSDGLIVGAGNYSQNFGTVRYSAIGTLDGTFGTAGLVDDSLGGAGGQALAVVLV